MNPSLILIWNARGLNQRDRRNAVYDVVRSANAPVVCLQETKVVVMTKRIFLYVFGSAYDKYIALPAVGTRGVLIAWKRNVC
jgi:exonuclease III